MQTHDELHRRISDKLSYLKETKELSFLKGAETSQVARKIKTNWASWKVHFPTQEPPGSFEVCSSFPYFISRHPDLEGILERQPSWNNICSYEWLHTHISIWNSNKTHLLTYLDLMVSLLYSLISSIYGRMDICAYHPRNNVTQWYDSYTD